MPLTNKSKTLLVLLVLSIITLFITVLNIINNDEIQHIQSKKAQPLHKPTPKEAVDNFDNQVEIKLKPTIIIKKDEPNPDNALYYSDDPFINESIIMGLYHNCTKLFYQDKKSKNKNIAKRKQTKTTKRKAERFKECQKINDEHPEFYLDNSEKSYKQQLKSGSLLEKGLSFKLGFGKDYETDRQFIKELNQVDSRVLLSPQTYAAMSSFHYTNSLAIVMGLIQSQQLSYANNLLDIGQNIYNCNRNNGCDKNSNLMYYLCMTDENYCDLENYNAFIETTMSQGQQADLAIVVEYIETLFENQ